MEQLDSKIVKQLLSEIKKLNKHFATSINNKRLNCSQFAQKIGIKPTTVRMHMMYANKGVQQYQKYLPHGISASGRQYWVQEQVDNFWGVGK